MPNRSISSVSCLGLLLLWTACALMPPPPGGVLQTQASTASANPVPPEMPRSGFVLPPGAGERLVYCARPLLLTLKVDSLTAPGTRMIAGTGEVRGDEGWGRHPEADEIIYVVRGSGEAIFGRDTASLVEGTVAFVPPGTPHRIKSTGAAPMEYLFIMAPRASAQGFRRAAQLGCAGAPTPAPAEPPPGGGQVRVILPEEGERLTYCDIPLDFTLKVDSTSVSGTRVRAATGRLRMGSEYGTHSTADEVAYITAGRGWAIVGPDTVPVEAGSAMFVPQGTPHGFINGQDEPLEYVVAHSPHTSPLGFRRRAALPGPYCSPR